VSSGFAIDRTGVAMIAVIAVVITPAAMFASAWVVTDGLDFAAASTFELVVAALSCLLALFVNRRSNELRPVGPHAQRARTRSGRRRS
jgi:hypothetical protein